MTLALSLEEVAIWELAVEHLSTSVASHSCAVDILFNSGLFVKNAACRKGTVMFGIYYNDGNKNFNLPPLFNNL